VIPMLAVASIWYLGLVTLLSIPQAWLERRYGWRRAVACDGLGTHHRAVLAAHLVARTRRRGRLPDLGRGHGGERRGRLVRSVRAVPQRVDALERTGQPGPHPGRRPGPGARRRVPGEQPVEVVRHQRTAPGSSGAASG
ncbi:hypothetical protein ACWD6S_33680, partial [Streptomyces zhihengii]